MFSVNPMYYVGFSTATIVASVILFQGFNTTDPANSISLLAGFITTFLGVHLLEISRKPAGFQAVNGHSALEGGLMNPRLSISGRMSIDGWNGVANTAIGGTTPTSAHARRSSGRQTLFNALDESDDGIDAVGMERLAEVEEEDDLQADERTHLRSGGQHDRNQRSASRSGSNSPHGMLSDPRRTTR
jgi:magnesium transporter